MHKHRLGFDLTWRAPMSVSLMDVVAWAKQHAPDREHARCSGMASGVLRPIFRDFIREREKRHGELVLDGMGSIPVDMDFRDPIYGFTAAELNAAVASKLSQLYPEWSRP